MRLADLSQVNSLTSNRKALKAAISSTSKGNVVHLSFDKCATGPGAQIHLVFDENIDWIMNTLLAERLKVEEKLGKLGVTLV